MTFLNRVLNALMLNAICAKDPETAEYYLDALLWGERFKRENFGD